MARIRVGLWLLSTWRPKVEGGTDDRGGGEVGDMVTGAVDVAHGGVIAHDHERVGSCRRRVREKGQQGVTGLLVCPAETRRLAAVVVNDDATQPVALGAVEHLDVKVRMPAHAVAGP